MIFTIMPLFLANVLGVKTAIIGLFEGISQSAASLLNLAGGWASDRTGNHKGLTVSGYALSTLVKPFLLIASSWGAVLGIRFGDRVGKGIRTSPRDALLADSVEQKDMGRSFGFHRALDTLGAVLGLSGAALIIFLMQRGDVLLLRPTFQTLVIIGTIPGMMGVLTVLLFVKAERHRRQQKADIDAAGQPREKLSRHFVVFLAVVFLFTLGNSSDAFLVLRAQDLGVSLFGILLLLVLFNVVFALLSIPAGALSDRIGRRSVIAIGWGFYAVLYLFFGLADASWQLIPLFALYGIYHAATEGVTRAYVADMAPGGKRGLPYGLYHGLVGVTLLPASLIAGYLWQWAGPSTTFYFGAGAAAAGLIGLLLLVPRQARAG
ncbi:MAG: MFS transporter [Chloroflexi bacterium]|nr:MFS transporter [Chloroflexota bacterium]